MAQIQIVLKQESTQTSVTANISLETGQQYDATESAIRATGAACVSSIRNLAQQNPNNVLDDNERESLLLTTDGDREEEAGIVSGRAFGEVFQKAADQLNAAVEEYTESVTDSEDPSDAIDSLLTVLDELFDVTDTQRRGQFNAGRIMSAFYLNYCLVVKYIKRHGYQKVLPFLKQLIPRLILYLFDIGFLGWLIEIGGWAVVTATTMTDPYISAIVRTFPRLSIAAGLVYIAWRLTKYFTGR